MANSHEVTDDGDSLGSCENSKSDYLNALEKLKGRDRVGVSSELLVTLLTGAGGASLSATAASVAGASTLLGSVQLGSLLGGVFVTTTPIGWVVGCAVAAAGVGYGLTQLVRSGQKQDFLRTELILGIRAKLSVFDKQEDVDNPQSEGSRLSENQNRQGENSSDSTDTGIAEFDSFIDRLKLAVDQDLLSQETATRLVAHVTDSTLSIEMACDRLDRIIARS